MAHNEGVVVNEEDDYYFDDPRRTAGELIWRLRSSFRESDFAKVVSILTARQNKLKEDIGSWNRANQRLKNLELSKRKADSEVKKWRTMYCLMESRISKLEAEAKELKSGEPIVRVSGENAIVENEILDMDDINVVGVNVSGVDNKNVEVENEVLNEDVVNFDEYVDSAAAQNPRLSPHEVDGVRVFGENNKIVELENEVLNEDMVDCDDYVDLMAAQNSGLAPREGSRRTPPRCVVEIIDSDDEFAPGGNLSGNELTPQRVANTVHSDQISLQNGTEMLKRKHDSSVGQNDNNDGAVVGRNKLQKAIHVHDGSPENHGSATDNNVETYLSTSSHFVEYMRDFGKKLKEEYATRNSKSEFHLNVSGGGCDDEDSSSSSSSSSDSDDGVNMNSDFSQRIPQQVDKKWEYEIDVFLSLGKDDELCLKAVCALYRQQISLGISPRKLPSASSRGFNHLNILRGTTLAKFLIDGDPQGMLKKSVSELLQFDRSGLVECRRIAIDHSKQLLEIYKKKEDPLFLPLS
ncbi:hypothetical protein Ddye_002807 [Dipteronia dyeriana]|uniref:Uncharacterized protein n=1 Tax=Dipteronia dyeriana TaxID=168575 RepID=A0AAD9XRS6_9ROSI|nr:hypothetical protein Ddye_002807 [Dipteronia dyeriana]